MKAKMLRQSPPADLCVLLAKVGEEFPDWVKEHRFHPKRRWKFDAAWPGLKVALEREGSTWTRGRHTRGKGYRDDCIKYNAAQTAGWLVVRYTADMAESGVALDQLLAALRSRT
jgi:hypothetical protein